MNSTDTFGTAINCIDGRAQAPITEWVKLHSGVIYVDMITEPGVNKILSDGRSEDVYSIYQKVQISVERHSSRIIAVAGHFDCVANPTSFDDQKAQIEESVELIKSWSLGLRVVGLYVNEWSAVDLIVDSDAGFEEMRSFL